MNDEKSIFDALHFTVHSDHPKLMRRMNIGWEYCETGAPSVDCKRPYGNSDVILDVAEITGCALVNDEVPESESDRLWNRHLEMRNFLQILCFFGEIPRGSYVRDNTWSKWKRVTP